MIVEDGDSSCLLMLVGGCSCVAVQELYCPSGTFPARASLCGDRGPAGELDNFILGGYFRVSESGEIIFCWT